MIVFPDPSVVRVTPSRVGTVSATLTDRQVNDHSTGKTTMQDKHVAELSDLDLEQVAGGKPDGDGGVDLGGVADIVGAAMSGSGGRGGRGRSGGRSGSSRGRSRSRR
jgi:hypothetical protein